MCGFRRAEERFERRRENRVMHNGQLQIRICNCLVFFRACRAQDSGICALVWDFVINRPENSFIFPLFRL